MALLRADGAALTPRWRPMLMHPERRRLLESRALHRVVAAGRRSGKTEDAKRIILVGDRGGHRGCLNPPDVPNPHFGICAPTREQVKRIWWDDIKAMSPRWAVTAINESDLWIQFVTGARLNLLGLDKPQRAEGDAYDGLIVDETAEIRPAAWSSSLFPTLNNRGRKPGWSMRIGRPKGRNHFFEWFVAAKTLADHAAFHWKSSEVLPLEMIAQARMVLDDRTFRQEFDADFVTFEGQVYYQFDPAQHLAALQYDPRLPLVLCWDFNVSPGVCLVLQEQQRASPICQLCGVPAPTGTLCPRCGQKSPPVVTTCLLDEVWVEQDSNTPRVCNDLCEDGHGQHGWAKRHRGKVYVYGDPSGSSRQTSAESTDYAQIREYLVRHWPDVEVRVKGHQPHQVDRVNAINTRLRKANGLVQVAVDPRRCERTVRDFEGVVYAKDSREIDKDGNKWLTHLTDALGYYLDYEHSPSREVTTIQAW